MTLTFIRTFILSHKILRNLFFFLGRRKANLKLLDNKIKTFKFSPNKTEKSLTVSLTSFPARITEVKYTIFSMLEQSLLPQKIILFLAESQFPNKEKDLPLELVNLQNEIFEIRFCEDLRSYKKLVPLLNEKNEQNVLICDDDIFYRKNTIKLLWENHLKNPKDVICHIGKKLSFDEKNNLLPYKNWPFVKSCTSKNDVLPIGGGCVLYPKEVLKKSSELKNIESFTKIAPFADDIWFWYSAIKESFCVSIPKKTIKKMIYINPEREYGITDGQTLTKLNEGKDMNDIQLKNLENCLSSSVFEFLNKGKQNENHSL